MIYANENFSHWIEHDPNVVFAFGLLGNGADGIVPLSRWINRKPTLLLIEKKVTLSNSADKWSVIRTYLGNYD